MTTHINPVPTLLGLALLGVAWRLGVFADPANRRAGLAAAATALVAIPVFEYVHQLNSLGNYVQLGIYISLLTVVTVFVRFGGQFRTTPDDSAR